MKRQLLGHTRNYQQKDLINILILLLGLSKQVHLNRSLKNISSHLFNQPSISQTRSIVRNRNQELLGRDRANKLSLKRRLSSRQLLISILLNPHHKSYISIRIYRQCHDPIRISYNFSKTLHIHKFNYFYL
jgi:hypothetical protein